MKLFLSLLVFMPVAAFAALVDPRLQQFARSTSGTTTVIVLMDVQNNGSLPYSGDRRGVFNYVSALTQASWNRVAPSLQTAIASKNIQLMSLHAISQSFSAKVTPAGLRVLANTVGITKIYLNAAITREPVLKRPVRPGLVAGLPYDLAIIGMDQMLKENPTLNGTGVLVGHIDTGVDGKHPAVAGKIVLFYNAAQKKTTDPVDSDEHGTHTAGTILGSPHNGVPMGMAPGAKLVSAAGLSGYDDMLNAMQFMLSPDSKPLSAFTPRMISNSWNCEGAPDLEAFYRAISAWEAAGILPVFSAGNSGPNPATITKPHEHPDALAVAAFGQDGKIADFSSRGPGNYNGQPTNKPDVAAPGVDVVSSIPGGGYEAMSGTSMAAPHVTGLTALLFQLNPQLTPAKVREILAKSSDYVNLQGESIPQMAWNPAFGYGRINAVKAVNAVKNLMMGFANRFSNMLSPSVGNMVPLDPNIGRVAPATGLVRGFKTDANRWIDGRRL